MLSLLFGCEDGRAFESGNELGMEEAETCPLLREAYFMLLPFSMFILFSLWISCNQRKLYLLSAVLGGSRKMGL